MSSSPNPTVQINQTIANMNLTYQVTAGLFCLLEQGMNVQYVWPMYSTLGFNADMTLDVGNPAPGLVTVQENLPTTTSSTTTLNTSSDHTIGITANITTGIEDGAPSANVSVGFEDTWSWGSSDTVSIPDWGVNQTNPGALVSQRGEQERYGRSHNSKLFGNVERWPGFFSDDRKPGGQPDRYKRPRTTGGEPAQPSHLCHNSGRSEQRGVFDHDHHYRPALQY